MLNTAAVSGVYRPPPEPPGGQTYTITGRVVDSSGNPVVGAAVKVYKDSVFYVGTTSTNYNGYFSLSTYQTRAPDWWQVRITKPGYLEKRVTSTSTYFGVITLVEDLLPPPEDPDIDILYTEWKNDEFTVHFDVD